MENKSLGTFIAFLRKEKRLTQKQLAELLNVSDKTVSHWECDETSPDISLLPLLAQTLGVTVDELLKGQKATPQPTVEHHYIPSKGEGVLDRVEHFASEAVNKIKENANSDIAHRYKYFRLLSLAGTLISCIVLASVGFSTATGASFGTYVNALFMPGFITLIGSLWTIAISLGFTIGARFYFAKELYPREGTEKKEKNYIYKANFFTYNNIFLVLCILTVPLIGIDILPLWATVAAVLIFLVAARLILTLILNKKGILKTDKKRLFAIKYIIGCGLSVVLVAGCLVFLQQVWAPTPENITFDNSADFIAFMETPAEKPANAYLIDGVEATTYPPTTILTPGWNEAPSSPVQSCPSTEANEEIGETVMGLCGRDWVTFRWLNKSICDFAYNDEQGTFHAITYEEKIKAKNLEVFLFEKSPVIFYLFVIADIFVCVVLYKRKIRALKEGQ